MKKLFLYILPLISCIPTYAQEATPVENPNRVLLVNTRGNYEGYVLDRISDIRFDKIDGEVKANIELFETGLDMIKLAVTRTADCEAFKIGVFPKNTADQLEANPLAAIQYIDMSSSTAYYQDFTNAELTGIDLHPSSDYAVMTYGIDRLGVACDIARADFRTPDPEIIGDPKVTMEQVSNTLTSFTLKFVPNDDVSEYYFVAGEAGSFQQQYEMFGPMMGFSRFEDMIKGWGIAQYEEYEYTYTDMAPNTEYEVLVVCADINGEMAPYQTFSACTASMGGPGEATVDIDIKGYYMTDGWWDSETESYVSKPAIRIVFTPNDQSSAYRYSLYKASEYDANKEAIQAQLQSEPWMPMVGWFYYEAVDTEFAVEENTEVVAIASAKNSEGVWGPVAEVRYTTPAQAAEQAPAAAPAKVAKNVNGIAVRSLSPETKASRIQAGRVPTFKPARKLQLSE